MSVRVLLLEAPEGFLEERRRKGLDHRDEMWDGVLHVVPPAAGRHQSLEAFLISLLMPVAQQRGLLVVPETGFFRPGRRDRDYRVPDLLVVAETDLRAHGVEGPAAAVVEIRSPQDQSYEKIPFYLGLGVEDVVLIDRDTLAVEVYRSLDADGQPVLADDTRVRALDVEFRRVDDDHLAVLMPDGATETIRPRP